MLSYISCEGFLYSFNWDTTLSWCFLSFVLSPIQSHRAGHNSENSSHRWLHTSPLLYLFPPRIRDNPGLPLTLIIGPLDILLLAILYNLGAPDYFPFSECEETFIQLRKKLTEALVLSYADAQKPYVLYVDVSFVGLDGVLHQEYPAGLSPKAFISRSLTPS